MNKLRKINSFVVAYIGCVGLVFGGVAHHQNQLITYLVAVISGWFLVVMAMHMERSKVDIATVIFEKDAKGRARQIYPPFKKFDPKDFKL